MEFFCEALFFIGRHHTHWYLRDFFVSEY